MSANDVRYALRQLRWLLRGYGNAGLEDWPARLPESPKAPSTVPAAQPAEQPAMPSISPAEQPAIPAPDTLLEDHAALLKEIRSDLGDCTRCRLHEGRDKLVFGEGSPVAPVVFVGEGPGFEENRQGRPFVGRAGQLLEKMIRAIGFEREDVYICNVVKCRPPNNRTPQKDEADTCTPFLRRQLEAIAPKVICTLGGPAAQALLETTAPVSRLRGGVRKWRGIPLVATFHPAYLLRTPAQKAAAWEDLKRVMEVLNR